jgi:hypothetical protein
VDKKTFGTFFGAVISLLRADWPQEISIPFVDLLLPRQAPFYGRHVFILAADKIGSGVEALPATAGQLWAVPTFGLGRHERNGPVLSAAVFVVDSVGHSD